MTYERVKHLKPEEFKRLSGVRKETFNQMVAGLRQAKQHLKPGRPSKLSLEDQVLMTLEYWREYRTYFHISLARNQHGGNRSDHIILGTVIKSMLIAIHFRSR